MINHMKQQGFLLMDVLLAAAFLGIITISLFPTVGFLLRRNTLTQGTVQANLLIQDGIETAYNLISVDWNSLSPGTYIKAVDTTGATPQFVLIPGTDEPIEARYKRTITVEQVKRSATDGKQDPQGAVDPKSRKITSKVTWNEGEKEVSHQASLLLYEL